MSEKDELRMAFNKIKEDIFNLKSEINSIKELFKELQNEIYTEKLHKLAQEETSTDQQINPTHPNNPTHNPTLRQEVRGLKSQNTDISIGNEGDPTDRQTDRQTDKRALQHINKHVKTDTDSIETNIKEAAEILESLDNIKREIRRKFKRITNQEMVVFSTIYQLEEEDINKSTYKQIASILKLSESSIRDYVQRIINKGIPINKTKFNNKLVILTISPSLKKIATLSTIIKLREL